MHSAPTVEFKRSGGSVADVESLTGTSLALQLLKAPVVFPHLCAKTTCSIFFFNRHFVSISARLSLWRAFRQRVSGEAMKEVEIYPSSERADSTYSSCASANVECVCSIIDSSCVQFVQNLNLMVPNCWQNSFAAVSMTEIMIFSECLCS